MILDTKGTHFYLTKELMLKLHENSYNCKDCPICDGDIVELGNYMSKKGIHVIKCDKTELKIKITSMVTKREYGFSNKEVDAILDFLTNKDRLKLKEVVGLPFNLNINRKIRRGKQPKIHHIYKITNQLNGKNYIGQTTQYETRFKKHYSKLVNDKHDNKNLQREWKKFTESDFTFELVEFCATKSRADSREIYWIECYREENLSLNILSGGYLDKKERILMDKSLKDNNLTNEELSEIKKMLSKGEKMKTIASKFGIFTQTVSKIKKEVELS